MPPRRCLVAPQNTFIENIVRLCESQNANFIVANSRIVDHPIVFASEGFCAMTGFSRYELLQKSASLTLMHGDLTTAESKERLASILDGEMSDQMEMLIYKRNSKPMWLSLKTAPIKNEKEVVVLILIIVNDISLSKHPIEVDTGSLGFGKFARFALSVTRNKVLSSSTNNNNIVNNNNNNTNNDNYNNQQTTVNITPIIIDTARRLVTCSAHTTKDSKKQPASLTINNQIAKDKVKSNTSINQPVHTAVDHSIPWYKQEAPRTPPHIILHYSRFKATWDWVILFLTVYTCVLTPYTATFHSKSCKNVVLICLDTLVDVFYVVDVFLNFHVTFVGPAGEVVSDPKVIRRTYLKRWFVLDLFACLPYDVFGAFLSSANKVSIMSDLALLRLLRITRVGRHVDLYIEYGASVLMLLIVMFVLIAHWFACIWYSIGVVEAKRGTSYGWLRRLAKELDIEYYLRNISTETTEDLPVPEDGNGLEEVESNIQRAWQGGPNEIMVYSTALYYTLSSMTSVGFGNVAAYTESEKIFTICMMIFGSLLYATIFGNVTTIFQQMYSSTGRYHEMLKNVKEFMELHDVPSNLSERVLDYVVSTWSITKGIDASKVLDYCPADMRADICVHLNRKVFYEQSAFRLASDSCLRALAIHFTLSHWAPGDMLFHQGESLESLCFIASGSLEVLQDDEIVAVLSAGDSLGDMFWREDTVGQCRANVRALTYCNLHIIKREPLMEVLNFYQPFANSFARNLKLTYNLRKRLIFRKIADVIRERELAERTKDNPPMDLAMNHPVRKLISRFRKTSNLKISVPRTGSIDDGDNQDNQSKHSDVTPVNKSPRDGNNSVDVPPSSTNAIPIVATKPTSLWKFPSRTSTGENLNLLTLTINDDNPSPISVTHINPMFGDLNETNTSAISSNSSKIVPGKKWSKLLAKANESEPTPSSNIQLPLKDRTTSIQKPANEFDKMNFYEMNCSLRNDMISLNNRMGGIDTRLSQILQMLKENIDNMQIPIGNKNVPLQINQFQIPSADPNEPLDLNISTDSSKTPLETKPGHPHRVTSRGKSDPVVCSSTPADVVSFQQPHTTSSRSRLPPHGVQSSVEFKIDLPGQLITPGETPPDDRELEPNLNYLTKLRKSKARKK